ncbi:nucleotidyltransferase [Thermosediminibacter oceani]|uniref:tRNA(Met) cytidine acetate ligase n=1 Tax=Thermosediminibacter oceani (strain ATCC BAA-1034 / DSM 16646 / JW/IW-1228P) TaxID=555079 RepID=D9S331_THEOJ|nr:nucleotidyltransferase [Thermosediminibacter oceani]ADL07808.1 cytidyltransferase-related domain protein [Thermosediminibacter oceani DSM 16646]
MKIVGVIAEYNPFHSGHMYHLSKIRSEFNPDAIVCAMSGNFVQRGEPAVFDKWARAEMALGGGADLVVEIPTCFATSTAEIFAEASVKLLSSTGLVNYLSFGIEEYRIEELNLIGKFFAEESPLFKALIKKYLKEGFSFPAAREKAALDLLSSQIPYDKLKLLSGLLKKPNFILGVEYVKAINKLGIDMEILPVLRKGAGYHEKSLQGKFSSASSIRHFLRENRHKEALNQLVFALPSHCIEIIEREISSGNGPVFYEDFELLILGILRRSFKEDISLIFDIKEGLENRIKRAAKKASSLAELVNEIKAKRYPETRIQRILTHILLNIEGELVSSRTPLYIRVLGFSQKGAEILRKIKEKSRLPVITRTAEYKNLENPARRMFEIDLLASDIYSLAKPSKSNRRGGTDFYKKIIHYNFSR